MGSEKWPSIPILDGKSDRGLLFVIMACSSTKMGGNGHRNWFLVLPKLLYLSCLAPFQNLRLILFDCASNSALNKSKGDWISICWRGWKELDCWLAIDRGKRPLSPWAGPCNLWKVISQIIQWGSNTSQWLIYSAILGMWSVRLYEGIIEVELIYREGAWPGFRASNSH